MALQKIRGNAGQTTKLKKKNSLLLVIRLTLPRVKIQSLFSNYLPNIESVRALKPEQCDTVSLLFYLHKPSPMLLTPVYLHVKQKKKKKIEQVVCPITTAHGGTGGPLAARHVRGPCAFGSGPGSSFWRSYAVATQGGLVVSFNMTIMYCTLSKFLLLLLYFIIVSNILRYSRTTVYIFLTLENK